MFRRATLADSRLTATAQFTAPVETVQEPFPAITKPLEAVVLFADRSTAVASRADMVATPDRSGPFTTAYTVFVPEVVDTEPESCVPRSL